MEIRGVQGGGVLKTLLDRKLIAVAGRKNVIGKPILYKTTKEFLIQFGLKDLSELPSLKEFEEIRRMAFADSEPPAGETVADAPKYCRKQWKRRQRRGSRSPRKRTAETPAERRITRRSPPPKPARRTRPQSEEN